MVGVLLPVVGLVFGVSVPLVRYALKDRYERIAIEVVGHIHEAQRAFRELSGGYAATSRSLITPCAKAPALLHPATLERLSAVGYVFEMRAARDATMGDLDCHGEAVADDYYFAVRPASAGAIARQAFATSSGGAIFLFYDGIAPVESDIETGLATPLEARETFKIP